MNALLVEDERLQLIRLKNEAAKALPEGTVFLSFSNPLTALEESKDIPIDIAFLDIEMPGIDGIGLGKELQKRNPKINIIFVTAYENYALFAMKLHASGYISKPVSAKKIADELACLRFPLESAEKKLRVKCFGNFEVFYDGKPVKFFYSKSKEVFAYLIDREGSVITINELNAVLWEEDHTSYLRNLISDIKKTLESLGCEGVFIKEHKGCCIDASKVICDAYLYRRGDIEAIRSYRGEYMIQYSWAYFKES